MTDRDNITLPRELVENAARRLEWNTSARDEIVLRLRAHLAVSEMWAALERYQPKADKAGHGELWKRMTTERTARAASAARVAAEAAEAWCAAAAADGASAAARAAAALAARCYAVEAIEYITEAMEAKP